jgi:serine/threonine protein kinase
MNLSGTQLGKYRIYNELGRGGMGAVYRGYDPALDRLVAIKVLAPHLTWEPRFVDRFLAEARTVAKLSHRNIVAIYDVDHQDGTYYLIMELVEGKPLSDIIAREGPMSPERAANILGQVAAALDCAHQQQIIHRDIKPGNILVTGSGQAKLTDFGIARAADGTRLTATGTTLGTPEYMSPEQARGGTADARSDIYALGVVLYEMLVGQVPFRAETPVAVLRLHADAQPRPPCELVPSLSTDVERVVLRALAKDPAVRYQVAGMLASDFEAAVAGHGVHVEPAGPINPPGNAKRRAVLWGAVALVVVAVLMGMCLMRPTPNPSLPTDAPATTPPDVSAFISATATPAVTSPVVYVPAATATLLPSSTSTATPTRTPSPTSTLTPSSTPMLTPTPTATPMYIPTPEPVVRDKIAFTSSRTGSKQVFMMNPDGSDVRQLTSTGANSGPAWSPDARWLAFTSTRDGNDEIYVMRVDGSDARNVSRLPNSSEGVPTWSPDGRQLAFVSDRGGNEDIWVINVDGSGLTQLTTVPAKDSMPDWSVRGQIAFRSDRMDNYNSKKDPEIYVMNADGSGQQNVSRDLAADYSPRWSPDGNRIVFKSHVDSTMDLFVMNADGSGKRRLTGELTYVYAADWSPDGDTLVFAMETDCPANQKKDCNLEIYRMAANTGPMTRLTFDDADDVGPVWSPDQ